MCDHTYESENLNHPMASETEPSETLVSEAEASEAATETAMTETPCPDEASAPVEEVEASAAPIADELSPMPDPVLEAAVQDPVATLTPTLSRTSPITRFWIAIIGLSTALALVMGILFGFFLHTVMDEGSVGTTTAIAEARDATVVIEVNSPFGSGIGTGVVMSSDGYIATNHHVISNATSVRVYFTDGTNAEAEVIGSSEMDDLAVIKVKKTGLKTATFTNNEACYVGQHVYAIGHPGSTQLSWTTTEGIVSYVDREMSFYDNNGDLEKKMILLQIDADVNPGNSGGPVINERGEVVGIVTMRVEDMGNAEPGFSTSGDVNYTGLGFALPADGAWDILQAIIRDGNADGVTSSISFKPAKMGINYVFVERGEKYTFTEDNVTVGHGDAAPISGIYVVSIPEGSVSEGTLRVGDILTEMGGYELTDANRFIAVINAAFPGEKVSVTLYRDGEYKKVKLILGASD